jgi:hypothetical protein
VTFPLAHAGHWALWVLYAVPVLIVLGSIVLQLIRNRDAGDAEQPLMAGDHARGEHEREPDQG